MVVDLVGTSENLVVLESVLNFWSFVKTDVAWVRDSVLVAKIIEVSWEVLNKVLAIEVLNWWSLSPLFLNLLSLLESVSYFNIMKLDTGIVVLNPLVNLLQVIGWNLTVWDLDSFILLLKRVEDGRVGWKSLLQSSEVDLWKISWKLANG